MNINEIIAELPIWDKWGYSVKSKEIICYTSWSESFDEKKQEFLITYKPKTWFAEVDFKMFLFIIQDRKARENFCGFKNDYFTERAKGEPMTEEDKERFKEMFED